MLNLRTIPIIHVYPYGFNLSNFNVTILILEVNTLLNFLQRGMYMGLMALFRRCCNRRTEGNTQSLAAYAPTDPATTAQIQQPTSPPLPLDPDPENRILVAQLTLDTDQSNPIIVVTPPSPTALIITSHQSSFRSKNHPAGTATPLPTSPSCDRNPADIRSPRKAPLPIVI
jgi:hypothetical protein